MEQSIVAAAEPIAPQRGPKPRNCAECGAEFIPARQHAAFCCKAHQTAFQNRSMSEGRAVIALLKAWRASRNRKDDRELGARCLSEVCAIVDQFMSDDREAGRPAPMPYAKHLLGQGRFIDRRRK